MKLSDLRKLVKHMVSVCSKYAEAKFDQAILADLFSKTIEQYMRTADESARYIAWSVFKYYNRKPINKETILSLASMLITFKPQIKLGIMPPLWEGKKTKAAMLCLGVSPAEEYKGKRRLLVHLICIGGEPAGLKFKVVLSCNLLEYVLGKRLGLSFKKYNAAAEEIAGCMFECLVSEDTVRSYLSDYDAAQAMKEHNRQLAEARCSYSKCKTPMIPCSACKKTRKQCNKAVWR